MSSNLFHIFHPSLIVSGRSVNLVPSVTFLLKAEVPVQVNYFKYIAMPKNHLSQFH